MRLTADHGEQVVRADLGVLAGQAVLGDHRLELAVTVYGGHHRLGEHRGVGIVLDAVEEVGRHGFGQAIAAHEHEDAVP